MKIRHTVTANPPTKTAKAATVITRVNFDEKVMYVGRRIRTAAIKHKALGLDIPRLTKQGFLIVHGDKPGLLIHEVRWDGNDIYQRDAKIGSLAALNSTKHEGYRAEIVDLHEVMRRARKVNHVVDCVNVATKQSHRIALLNKNGDPYVAGLEFRGSHLHAINLEPRAPYNDARVQFHQYVDVKIDIGRFLLGKNA